MDGWTDSNRFLWIRGPERLRQGGLLGRLSAEGVAVQAPLGAVLRGVDLDQSVPDGFVEHPDERGDGVPDGRGPVTMFPLIDGAIDDPGRDLGDRQVPERGQHPQLQPAPVDLACGGRVQAAPTCRRWR